MRPVARDGITTLPPEEMEDDDEGGGIMEDELGAGGTAMRGLSWADN
jgi:hypothetical protein